ncbi:arf-GAP with Rho-GAP domain, ANK repeat and PH domain-containing protein 1 isoform X1 [Euwallacea fornicatus]|uniref:arf-GAP with Rho-GAP domain, ANK repeat and PH domain-containing protein 1 isoform X1 n=2 Tax=Euwallacea fornicatus TaxID=995702 RepID=UPI00338F7373
MEKPVPAPRESKKPVPTPRRNAGSSRSVQTATNENEKTHRTESTEIDIVETSIEKNSSGKIGGDKGEQVNTFSRRVTNASKQIAGDLGQLVQHRKKAVIEGTRQSMRRITRKFSLVSQDVTRKPVKEKDKGQDHLDVEMFKNISFESPLSRTNSIYSNVENELGSEGSSNESLNLPPPQHPPPPLPDVSLYDAPSSSSPVPSSSNSSGVNIKRPEEYESVFPAAPYNSDSDGCIDNTESNVEENMNLSRSASWSFYDSVDLATAHTQDNIYSNIEKRSRSDLTSNSVDRINNAVLIPDKIDVNQGTSVQRPESNVSSESHQNSIYENHQISLKRFERPAEKIRASKSVIMQFDPLSTDALDTSATEFSEMNLLEELLQGDLYGNISEAYTFDDADWSVSNESEGGEDFLNPPTPPLRFDSLPEEEGTLHEETKKEDEKPPQVGNVKSRTSWFTDDNVTASRGPIVEPKKNWLKQVFDKAPEVFKSNKSNENLVLQRPQLGGRKFVNKKGMLYKVQGGPVEDLFGEYSGRWCVLENSDLFCYSDNTCQHLREHIAASNILSIQVLQDAKYKYKYDNDDLHCFELNITGKSRGGHIYGSRNVSERRYWLQSLAEMLTQRFKSRLTTNFIRMGWAYVREGVSGEWAGAWIILSERELHYAIDKHSVKIMDLRKARSVGLQGFQDSDKNPKTNDRGPNMLVDCQDLVLYLRMWTSRETKVWHHILKLEAHNNGANIDQQQLTKNDIPVIVEKCINFIYVHGSMSEGIYRKAGTGSSISDLLSKFRKDAFAVQLTRNAYSEYEVGTALKRFFREFPEPLFGCDHRQYLYEVTKHNVKDEKVRMFKAALDQLPPVSYKTARKLLGHLHFISNQSAKNLMTVENLASIWGPTLVHYEDKDEKMNKSNGALHVQDAEVVCQLIKYYRSIFPEDPGELEREKMMLTVLKKCTQSPQGAVNQKIAGDLRVWIYIFNKHGKALNLGIGPQRTAYEVCLEISETINTPVHKIILEETVLGDRLTRPLHHTEKVLDVVLRWSYWDECDRKDNYLTCVNLSKYTEYMGGKPATLSGELKFADSKSRLFKPFMFQFTQGSLTVFKDKHSSDVNQYQHSWRIEEITWYLGHEQKRMPQSRWTATFLLNGHNPNRTRASPYFGNVVVWSDAEVRTNWLRTMLSARYPNNLTPPPRLVTF